MEGEDVGVRYVCCWEITKTVRWSSKESQMASASADHQVQVLKRRGAGRRRTIPPTTPAVSAAAAASLVSSEQEVLKGVTTFWCSHCMFVEDRPRRGCVAVRRV